MDRLSELASGTSPSTGSTNDYDESKFYVKIQALHHTKDAVQVHSEDQFRELISVRHENHMKSINTLCGGEEGNGMFGSYTWCYVQCALNFRVKFHSKIIFPYTSGSSRPSFEGVIVTIL